MGSIIIVLLIIAVCFYYGILYVNSKILLVGFALLLLFLFSFAELIYRYLTVSAYVEIPISIAEQEQPFHMGICVNNKGRLPMGRMGVCMGVKNRFELKEKKDWISFSGISCGQAFFDTKVVLKQAGNHVFFIEKIRLYSIMGLLSIKKKCIDVGSVLVMPKIHAIGINITEQTRHFIADAEIYDAFRAGHDVTETFEIRNYQPKDKLQNIHWKLSAKMDELMVKENGLPKPCCIVLMAEIKNAKDFSISAFLELFVSLSFALMDAKCSHYVAWYGMDGELVRVRIDDEESYYMFLNHYLNDVTIAEDVDIRQDYREKYKGEPYLHDVLVTEDLQVFCDGEFLTQLDANELEEACRKLEIFL